MYIFKKLIFLLSIITLFSIENVMQERRILSNLNWMIGKWKSESAESKTIESWQQISTKTFEGFGLNQDAGTNQLRSMETLRLVEMSGEIFYIAKVEQNVLPVIFRATEITDSLITFENNEHNFPQKITYSKINDNRMNVIVEDNTESFTLNFIRVR